MPKKNSQSSQNIELESVSQMVRHTDKAMHKNQPNVLILMMDTEPLLLESAILSPGENTMGSENCI
jgi:hypothetical protein